MIRVIKGDTGRFDYSSYIHMLLDTPHMSLFNPYTTTHIRAMYSPRRVLPQVGYFDDGELILSPKRIACR